MRTTCTTLLFVALIANTPMVWASSTESWRLVAGPTESPLTIDLLINLDAPLLPPQQTGGVNGVPVDPVGFGFSNVISSISINGQLMNLESTQSTAWHANQDTLSVSMYPSSLDGIGALLLTSPGASKTGPVGLIDILSNMTVNTFEKQLQLNLFSANTASITAMPVTSFTPLPELPTANMLLAGLLVTVGIKFNRSKFNSQSSTQC